VVIGEVGLAGEVRRVAGVQRRLAEAERLGFRVAVVPAGTGQLPGPGPQAGPDNLKSLMSVKEVRDVREAITVALAG